MSFRGVVEVHDTIAVFGLWHYASNPEYQTQLHSKYWVAAKELELCYRNSDTILFTMYPYYGDIN